MAYNVTEGNVPYYGIYGNSAQKMFNSLPASNSNGKLYYIPSWRISLGNKSYYILLDGEYLRLYDYSPTTYYVLEDAWNSSTDTSSLQRVYKALQPTITIDLFWYTPYISGSSKNCSVYISDYGNERLFIHIDYDDGKCYEAVIVNSGYIQIYTSNITKTRTVSYRLNISPFYEYVGGCSSCPFTECSYYGGARTSCYYGVSYKLEDSVTDNIPKSSILMTFDTSTNRFVFDDSHYLSGMSSLSESNDVVCIRSNNKTSRIPLKASPSPPGMAFRVNGTTKYLPFGADTASQPYSECSPLRLYLNNSVLSPQISRTGVKDIKSSHPFYLDTFSYVTIYTYGSSPSGSYRNFTGATIFTLSERIRVSGIRLIGSMSGDYGTNILPNNSYKNMYMHINTGASDISPTWTSSNTTRYEFSAGYTGSGGGFGKEVAVSISHSGYVKQFAFTPACTETSSSYSGFWNSFTPSAIIFIDYSTGNSFTYTI